MTNRTPFNWIINHFTYFQTFVFICSLFFVSLIPIGYFWIDTHLRSIDLINEQLDELDEERALKTLFNVMQNHRALAQRMLYIDNDELKKQMAQMDVRIQSAMTDFLEKDRSSQGMFPFEPNIWKQIGPQHIQTRWEEMIDQFNRMSHKEIEPLHTNIIHDLLIQFSYLSDKVGITTFNEMENYSILEVITLRIPVIQENTAQMILLAERFLLSGGKDLSDERIVMLISSLGSDLSYLEFGDSLENSASPSLMKESLIVSLNKYRASIQNLIQFVQTNILQHSDPLIPFSEIKSIGDQTLKNGNLLWTESFQDLQFIFQSEKTHITYRLWLVLIATLALTGFAFLLGLVLTLSGTSRLSQLTEATDSFTNGNLAIRVPDENRDEIGRQAQAFNRMAQKLEEIINHLYELLGATSALAAGDLTARIEAHKGETEFDQVALSFNQMAETFETIMGRLQQIGILLTSSASEIATASKDQETIVVEQEATTRKIAIAANEISTTAKEYANTMNEMSHVADQTSDLALTGKDSLTNMETIMSQMVDASSNIASKLAVLNEKAGNITGVITTITKVADQTNLLSLNASIEAEKAGEYGKSFAVIAREIRRLADQSAVATLDIETIIDEIMSAVSTSVMGVDDFTQEIRNGVQQVRTVSGQLATIIEQVQVFTARFEVLNQGMQAQSTGAEQINEAISQLSQTAQQTSVAIHQFHKTIQELNQAANELRILTRFTRSSGEKETTNTPSEGNKIAPFQPKSDVQVKNHLSKSNESSN